MIEHLPSGGPSHPSTPGFTPLVPSGLPRTPSSPVLSQPRSSRPDTPRASAAVPVPPQEAARRGTGAPAPAGDAPRAEASAETQASAGTAAGGETTRKRRRRGSRGGRRRSGKKRDGEAAESAPTTEDDAASTQPEAARPEPSADGPAPGGRRRSRSRSSTASRRTEAPSAKDDAPATGSDEKPERKRRKRGSRGGKRGKKKTSAVEIEFIPGEEDDLPELVELPADAVLVSGGGERERGSRKKSTARSKKKSRSKAGTDGQGGRKKRTRRSRRDEEDDEPLATPAPAKKRQILVNAGAAEETRVAVVEDGRIVELQMTVKKHVSFVNDIYRGRVVNLEPAIGAAFVDFGQGRNGFLHASDVLPSYGKPDWNLDQLLSTPVDSDDLDKEEEGETDGETDADAEAAAEKEEEKVRSRAKARVRRGRVRRPRIPIEKLVKKGEMVVVQITKDAIGDKGPTLTTYVSIPGRYLVLMPSLERTGVSRKIEDEKERRRLKRNLSALEIPEGMGVIVRTAGIGKTKAELKRDLEYLLLAWEEFALRLKSGRNPAPLYQESDVAIRTMRDLYTAETEAVIVDEDEMHERVIEFTKKLMPDQMDRIRRHDGPRPLFQSYGVEQDFEKIFAHRVELPSGGSIVIDQTEALVAIDVNSGRTRADGAEFEDIALKTNLEAAPEIARQIRLRDLGGIIVLDYIDMMRAGNRRAVEGATRAALQLDRARSKVGRISQFGLLELTRQRLGPGLSKLLYDPCQTCRGSGRRRNASSRAQAILRRLGASLALKGFTSVEVRAHPEVIEYLKAQMQPELDRLEEGSGRKLILMSVPDQVEDSVLHYLRADGREVRPGGRRKR